MQIPDNSFPHTIKLGIYGISDIRRVTEQITQIGHQIIYQGSLLVDKTKAPLPIHTETFRCLGYHFFADKDNMYGMTYYKSELYFTLIPNVDFETFEIINMHYAKDKNLSYYASGGKILKEQDLMPLTAYTNIYQKEHYPELEQTYTWMSTIAIGKKAVYNMGKKVQGADPKSFHQIGKYYYKDAYSVFLKYGTVLRKLKNVDVASFIELSDRAHSYASDKYKPVQCLDGTKQPKDWFNFYRKDFEKLRGIIDSDYWWYQLEKKSNL